MAMLPTDSTETNNTLSSLWVAACTDYTDETGSILNDEELRNLQGPDDLLRRLDNEKDNFEDFRVKRRPLLRAMQTVVAPFETWGDLITGAAGTAFPPASSIMGAMLLLVRGARKVSEAFDMITDLFRKLAHFSLRLDSYKDVPLSEGMQTIIVKVMVNSLRVCAVSQKLLRRGSLKGRLTKWAKNALAEDTEVSSLMGELEDLTSQEHMMVSAHGLKMTNQALRNTEELLERDHMKRDQEKLEKVKAALQPVSASSQVFSFTNENRMPGSGSWIDDRLRTWWQGADALLWLHGGPGVGKSHLASRIITGLANGELSDTTPLVASFFCRNNDVDLRSLNKAFRTLAWQIATQSPSFITHVEEFCLKEDAEDTYVLWRKLLIRHLAEKPSVETCFVIDGLDEMEPDELETFVSLLEKNFSDGDTETRPPLRFVLLSRDSIRPVLEGHSLEYIPDIEVGSNENKDDLHDYVSRKLQATKMFRSAPDLKEEIVREISREAEGLWEWANMVIKGVLQCRTKEKIRKIIKTTPRGISAMLNQELQRLAKELSLSEGSESSSNDDSTEESATQIDQLNVILSFVTLAQKPLNLWQLDVILRVIFKEEVLNLEDDIRSIYSSLFQIRHTVDWDTDEDSDFVILRHSSFYEYFRASQNSGHIHVNLGQAEADFLFVILETLRSTANSSIYTSMRIFVRNPSPEQIFFGDFKVYAEEFLPWHLMRANPERAGKRREEISTLFDELFSQERIAKWFVIVFEKIGYRQYCFNRSSRLSKAGEFWVPAEGHATANSRAELVLNWFSPETKLKFENNARSAEKSSDACPFTVLFSFLVEIWVRLWLSPDETRVNEEDEDGWPAAIPHLVRLYELMAMVKRQPEQDAQLKSILQTNWDDAMPIIMEAAEFGKPEHDAMWHFRVGQALLLNGNGQEAYQNFLAVFGDERNADILNERRFSILHRDMARACTEIERHTEALKHAEIAELTAPVKDENPADLDRVQRLLNLAQLKYHAKERDGAIATANEAWKELSTDKRLVYAPVFVHVFDIFFKLRQFERLGAVLDGAAEQIKTTANSEEQWTTKFADFIFSAFVHDPATMYGVFKIVLKEDDQDRLLHFAKAMAIIDTLSREYYNILDLRYYSSAMLFEKGRSDLGIQGWSQLLALDEIPGGTSTSYENSRERSLAHLVGVCLSDADIPPCETFPIALDTMADSGEACLVVSSWLQSHGHSQNARHALRGRVRACATVIPEADSEHLSDGLNARMALFETFLMDRGSEEDLGAVLYWMKRDHERTVQAHHDHFGLEHNPEAKENTHGSDGFEFFEPLPTRRFVTRCSICAQEIRNIHHWYFCRSCPFKTCCRECSGKIQPLATPSGTFKCPGICDDEHDFFCTAGHIQETERVPEGMLPIVSSNGESSAVSFEEWKDGLVKKWDTADFSFDGGLSAWCMSILPEQQRVRWAKMFKV